MPRAVLIAARRTPVAPRGGALARIDAPELAAHAARACLSDAGLAPDDIDELILANGLGAGGNPARIAALAAGLPERVGGLTIDRQCTGGLDAVLLAAALIESGRATNVLAGGAESFSRRPLRMATDPDGGPPQPYLRPRFSPDPARDPDMPEAADALAIARAAQDAYAADSHCKALAAPPLPEIAPLAELAADPYARTLSARLLARAKPLSGNITAANTAPEADAAALLLVTTEARAQSLGLPFVHIGPSAMLGGDPSQPGLAPVAAIQAVLTEANLTPEQIDHFELMEAFAAQAIATLNATGLREPRTNPQGGALARGHPIGASGAILACRLFHALTAPGGPSTGLATIAAAGGLGSAALFTRP
ncbi:thiolase family protein [Vannielia litorea]|uniref:thiolase family protein n=1 Tax=Vannielia litorea TaxID=1217970 RepID=UPI001C9533E7|nr:thiolase family protein [Vannielia litorea]MBY6047996.1 thiolase family protein [Vannielia litorea]MBY6075410.1 thiolase family protein [Vannielia litorea]